MAPAHPVKRPRPFAGLPGFASPRLTGSLAILAQTHLQKDEAGREHEPEADQRECDDLAERSAECDCAGGAGNDKYRG